MRVNHTDGAVPENGLIVQSVVTDQDVHHAKEAHQRNDVIVNGHVNEADVTMKVAVHIAMDDLEVGIVMHPAQAELETVAVIITVKGN